MNFNSHVPVFSLQVSYCLNILLIFKPRLPCYYAVIPGHFSHGIPDVKSVLLMLISYLYFDCRGRLHISKYGQWFIDPLPSSFSKTILTYRRVCFKPQCNIHFVCFSSGFPVQNIWWTVNRYTASFRFLNNWRPRQITSMLVCMYGSW